MPNVPDSVCDLLHEDARMNYLCISTGYQDIGGIGRKLRKPNASLSVSKAGQKVRKETQAQSEPCVIYTVTAYTCSFHCVVFCAL